MPKVGDLNDGFELLLETDLENDEEKTVEEHLETILLDQEDIKNGIEETEENLGTP